MGYRLNRKPILKDGEFTGRLYIESESIEHDFSYIEALRLKKKR